MTLPHPPILTLTKPRVAPPGTAQMGSPQLIVLAAWTTEVSL